MPIPYESLVLIAASGGSIIVFAIIIALVCLCRHARRSQEAVIHILATAPPMDEPLAQTVDFCVGETNQLLRRAATARTYQQKTKISMKTKYPRSHPSAPLRESQRMAEPLKLPRTPVETRVVVQPVHQQRSVHQQRQPARQELTVEAGPSTWHQRPTTVLEHVVVIDGSEPPPPYRC